MNNRLIALLMGVWGVVATSWAVEVVTTTLSNGVELVPYSAVLDATNGASPYTWSVNPALIGGGGVSIGAITIPDDLTNVVGIAGGQWHSLALKDDGTVRLLAGAGSGELAIPAGLSNVVAVAAGYSHSLALRINGTVVAWGNNYYGQTNVPAGLTNVIAVSGGERHSLVLKSDGTVVAWGGNHYGQTNVPPSLSNVVKIAAGKDFNFALKSDGTVVTWGQNNNGLLTVPAGLSNVVALAAGGGHCLALTSNGYVTAWGGSGPMTVVPAGLSNVVAVAAGESHSVALKADGSIIVFGQNNGNQLNFPAGISNVVAIAAGGFHTLALRSRSTELPAGLACATNGVVSGAPILAGTNEVTFVVRDSLGATTNKTLKIVIEPGVNARPVISSNSPPVGAVSVAEGGASQLFQLWANDPEGSNLTYSWTWDGVGVGSNSSSYTHTTTWGGLGIHQLRCYVSDGVWSNVVYSQWSVDVTDIPVEITTATMPPGGERQPYSTGLTATNGVAPYTWSVPSSLVAWGDNQAGQSTIAPELTDVVGLAAGSWHSMALKSDGTVVAWGSDNYGKRDVPAGLAAVVAIAGGEDHSLAVQVNGTVVAWGKNDYGQATVPAGLSNGVAVAGGREHSVALRSDGTVVAWGDNQYGQTNVPAGLSNVVAIASSFDNSMALRSNGTVAVWGYNGDGQTNVPAGLSNVVAIAGGGEHILALKADGTLVAWGDSAGGLLNVPAGLSNVVAVAAGASHSVALKSDGAVVVWGRDGNHQTDLPAGLTNVVKLVAGGYHTLALRAKSTALPEGLVCSSSGMVSGTPVLAGTNRVTFAVRDALGATVSKPLDIVISPHANTRPVISSNTPPVVAIDLAEGGQSQLFQIWANDPEGSNLTYSWTWDGAAVGSNVSAYTRTTSWGGIGIHCLRCTVSDGFWSNHVSAAWVVTVRDIPLEIRTSALPAGQEMVPYSLSLEVTNGVAPYVWNSGITELPAGWSLSSTELPAGLSCSTNGVVSGRPVQAVTSLVMFIVQDSAGVITNKTLEIAIAPNPNLRPVVTTTTPSTEAVSLIEGGASRLFQVSANDPEGSNLIYSWTWDGQPVGVNASNYTRTTSWEGPGEHVLRCDVSDGLWTNIVFAQWAVTVEDIPIKIMTSSLTGCPPLVAYSTVLQATNGAVPYRWNIKAPVVGWGNDEYGETDVPDELSSVVALACGEYQSLALQSDGRVVAWGNNDEGQTEVPAGLSNVVAIAAGSYFNLALQSNGLVVAWGSNWFGQTNVPPDLTNVVSLAAGGYHCLARQGNGRVVGWGYNDEGETDVPSNLTAVAAIAAGQCHSLALQSNGLVVVWGDNTDGQTNVPPGLSNVVAVAAGGFHSLALQADGRVVAWGNEEVGATDVPPGLSNVVAIAAGLYHSLALQSNGTVVAWGSDDNGQTSLPADLAPARLIAAGGLHSLALRSSAMDLPAGLTCSSSGILSGTPTLAGIHRMTVAVQDQLGARTNKTLILVVGPDRATNNVPTWWLAQYGLTNFNADAMQDLDGDGLLNWQEWVAGCDPADIRSVFGMTGAGRSTAGQNMVLRWPSIPDRVYDLSWTTNLLAGPNSFTFLTGGTNLPATPPENVHTTAVQNVGPCFYRIGVRE